MPLDLIFVTPGNYTVEDNGIPGDGISVIKDGTGTVILTFVHPADSLSFVVSTPGVNLTINMTDSLGAANFRIGVLDDPAQSPDSITMRSLNTTGVVTLVSNGAIVEGGNDAQADIVAGQLIMSAQTGVGTGADAIETQVAVLEAETVTGGINLANEGALQIGGITDLVNGLDVATSGNLILTNIGSIFLSEVDLDPGNPPSPLQSVHGGNTSGNVTLTALGFSADIIANTDIDAITAPRGSITVNAGRDISFGTVGANFDNDVRASGSVTINAGRDFLVDGFSDIASDDFGLATGGDLIVTVGRNIHLRNVAGTDASIFANGNAGADVILTTGFNGAVILDTPSAIGVDPLESNSGDVIINADRMLISAATSIRADAGDVVLRPATEGREIFIGSAGDAALALELSDTELNRVLSPNLTIGGDSSGQVRVLAAINLAAAANLTLRSGTDVVIEQNVSVATSLTLRAGDNVFIFPSTINVPTFAAFADQAGDDGGTGGVINLNALVAATTSTLTGNAEADTITGTSTNESLFGLGGNDVLNGAGGTDTLDGGAGADQMNGGLGDDTYMVDNAGDVITEAVGEGTDAVITALTHTLAANVENLTLTGAGNVNGTGNGLANFIFGNSGNNVLDGLGGADTMNGGLGNDTYVVDNGGDSISESAAGGTDLVLASVTFTLAPNVENLTLTGAGNIDGTGNALANILIGNSGNNVLDGMGGADQMTGGLGDDSYVIDVAGDVITEAAGQGTDTVRSFFTYTLLANFENLTLLGAANINGTGNAVANVLTGNSGANTLNGLAGADSMAGGLGNDIYIVDNAGDTVTEAAASGSDNVQSSVTFTLSDNIEGLVLTGAGNINGTGNSQTNQITGNSGNNILDGGLGIDLLFGGDGNDTYIIETVGDQATETSATGGIDSVQSAFSYTLTANMENLTLTGVASINGTGNGLDNLILGNNGNNTLDGAGGNDTMRGGIGNDTYIVAVAGDVVDETGGGGIDTVQSAINFTLAGNLENLTLTGAALTGTGNALNNVIIGNANANTLTGLAGDDTLNGGAGADTMVGGADDDTYVVDNAGDVTTEGAGAGNDTVQSSISWTLAANIEKLVLTGGAAINGTGNGLINQITGNAAANVLDGGAGNDLMFGGDGNDTYMVDNVSDKATEVSNTGGTDTVISSVTFGLSTKVENLTLTGTAAINAKGNELNNVLIGNSGNNSLIGNAGADTMSGGLGDDTYEVDNVGDVVTELAGQGTDTVLSSITFTIASTLENLTLTGAGAINGTGNNNANVLRGNAAANTLTGLSGNDRLDGGAGADTMIGGNDDDTYVVDNAGDVVTEAAGAGTDTVEVGFSYTLPANVERLILTGVGNTNGTGNALVNVLNGNAGANTLDGGASADQMFGGDGNDTYMVDNVGDTATEVSDTGGTDRVISTVSFNLGNRIENLTLAGAGAIDGRGNALDNIILGNGSTNVLRGGLGADTLTGNGGNDRFRYDDVAESTSALRDDITDFSAGDLIDLSVIDGNGAAAGNAFTFIGGGAFSGTAGELRVVNLGGGGFRVEGDTNGDSVADLVIDVTAIGGHVLGVGDFVL